MSEDKNIKNYSAADIEKYWKGQLNNSEMHALEKAAMDDSFLAEALEGYKNSLAPVYEINILKDKLAERISTSPKIVSINTKKYYWLKVAAAIVVTDAVSSSFKEKATDNLVFFKPETKAALLAKVYTGFTPLIIIV